MYVSQHCVYVTVIIIIIITVRVYYCCIGCKRLKRTADQSQTVDDELCLPTVKKNKMSC